jgi:hypothetical protein
VTDFISQRITEFGLDCYRHDANIAPLEFWRAADAADRQVRGQKVDTPP